MCSTVSDNLETETLGSEDNSDSEEEKGISQTRKKPKYDSNYRTEWQKCYSWLRPHKTNKHRAFCVLCKKEFSINQGLHQV